MEAQESRKDDGYRGFRKRLRESHSLQVSFECSKCGRRDNNYLWAAIHYGKCVPRSEPPSLEDRHLCPECLITRRHDRIGNLLARKCAELGWRVRKEYRCRLDDSRDTSSRLNPAR
ncbi:hypothetical protein CDAR_29111 [Caerostris darwini]|uniref:Recombination activating protein 1 n=1 Tax=Caerostris darwini TaxID=1538125 RepID=A0AAV4V3S9_9ARAC|nr:hypothetical protein CDAR_29111 [Caerostris darwini]